MIFRTIASASRTLSQALAPAAVLIREYGEAGNSSAARSKADLLLPCTVALVIYTGFVIPTRNMLGWSRWMNYLDPIAYGFEALMVSGQRAKLARASQS